MKKIAHLNSQSSILSPGGRAALLSAQEMAKTTGHFEVVEIATGEVVHTVNVYDKSESEVAKIERGLLRQMNQDAFFVRYVE